MSRGWIAWMLGRLADVIEPSYEVERIFRLLPQDERGYFMRSVAATLRIGAFRDLGQYSRFLEESDAALREATATENHHARLSLALNETVADACRGTPEASVCRLEAQRPTLPQRRFGMLRALHMVSVARAACATGQYEWGMRRFAEDWPLFLQSPVSRAGFLALLGRASRISLLMNASFAAGGRADVEERVGADLKALSAMQVPGSSAMTCRFKARFALLQGHGARAADSMRQTTREYENLGWLGEAACTRYALGILVAGTEGAALREAGEAFLRREQIAEPVAYVRGVYPEVFGAR
jgi:hypothetical protein